MNKYCLVLVFVVAVVEHLLKGKRMNFLRSKDQFEEVKGAALTLHTTSLNRYNTLSGKKSPQSPFKKRSAMCSRCCYVSLRYITLMKNKK